MLWQAIFFIALLLESVVTPTFAQDTDNQDTAMPTIAQQYVDDFKKGKHFSEDERWENLNTYSLTGKSSISLLTNELAKNPVDVRRDIINLLEALGLRLDSPGPDKVRVIRSHSIIEALIVGGFAKDDAADSDAIRVLTRRCRPQDLAVFSHYYIEFFKRSDFRSLLVAAKAKTAEARPYVEDFARAAEERGTITPRGPARIAQAALGNSLVEESFINDVRTAEADMPNGKSGRWYDNSNEKDASEVAHRINRLGLIGTKRALLVACGYLRSTLKSFIPNVSERSLRLDALKAIQYNFPDEKLLYRPTSTSEWAAIEAFCTRQLGAVFDGPTPEWEPDNLYPNEVM